MSDLNPMVSVIISTYNRADLIGEAIQSVLRQTHQNLELIVVDDGSTDDTRVVVEGFRDRRIRYIFTDNWGGPARPRNIGISKAKGEYVAFCDDDDFWFSNKIEEQLQHFDDDIIGVGSSAIIVGNLIFNKRVKNFNLDHTLDFSDLLIGEAAPLSSLMIRNENLMFDENEKFKFVEDFEFQLRITLETNKKIKIISKPLIFYRIHAKNESADIKKAYSIFYVYKKYRELISDKQIAKCYYKSYFYLGIKSLRIGDQKSKEFLVLALKYADIRRKCLMFLLVICSILPRIVIQKMLIMYYNFYNYLIK